MPEAAFAKSRRHLLGYLPAQTVARLAAVAKNVTRLRRNHIGRIGDDEVKLLAGDRLKPAAVAEVDVGDAIQLGIESGDVEGTAIEIGGDDALGELGGVDGLHTATGAKIKDGFHQLANGEGSQRH